VTATATSVDASSITTAFRTSFSQHQRRTLELIGELEVLLRTLPDEHVCWLIAFLVGSGARRPLERRDPWSVLLAPHGARA